MRKVNRWRANQEGVDDFYVNYEKTFRLVHMRLVKALIMYGPVTSDFSSSTCVWKTASRVLAYIALSSTFIRFITFPKMVGYSIYKVSTTTFLLPPRYSFDHDRSNKKHSRECLNSKEIFCPDLSRDHFNYKFAKNWWSFGENQKQVSRLVFPEDPGPARTKTLMDGKLRGKYLVDILLFIATRTRKSY